MDKEELEKQMKQMNEKFERSFEAWRKKRNTAIKEVLNVLVDSDLTYEEAVSQCVRWMPDISAAQPEDREH